MSIRFVNSLRLYIFEHCRPQNDFSRIYIEAQCVELTAIIVGRRQPQSFAIDYRRRMAASRYRDFPGHIRFFVPFERKLCQTTMAIACRAAKLRPVVSNSDQRTENQGDDQSSHDKCRCSANMK